MICLLSNGNFLVQNALYFQAAPEPKLINPSQGKQLHINASSTDGLKMGSITEVWKNGREWEKFTEFLDKCEPEGYDSEGIPMKLSRYAKFLKLYVNLHYSEQEPAQNKDNLKRMIEDIKNDPEGFFDSERCLKCLNAGTRAEILENCKSLKKGLVDPGAWILQPAYSPVLDKLNHLLGSYHTINAVNTM